MPTWGRQKADRTVCGNVGRTFDVVVEKTEEKSNEDSTFAAESDNADESAETTPWGRVQSREYIKKINEDESEKHTAYEVSVSKLEYVDE